MEFHLFIYDYVCLFFFCSFLYSYMDLIVGGEKLKKLEIFPAAAP